MPPGTRPRQQLDSLGKPSCMSHAPAPAQPTAPSGTCVRAPHLDRSPMQHGMHVRQDKHKRRMRSSQHPSAELALSLNRASCCSSHFAMPHLCALSTHTQLQCSTAVKYLTAVEYKQSSSVHTQAQETNSARSRDPLAVLHLGQVQHRDALVPQRAQEQLAISLHR